MRLKCPDCDEVVSRVRGSYKIIAESDLRFTNDGAIIKPAVAPLEVTAQSLEVSQVTCPACHTVNSLETWTIIVGCIGCGDYLAEFQAGTNIEATELYCQHEGSFLCKRCAARYGACEVCPNRLTCPLINKEE